MIKAQQATELDGHKIHPLALMFPPMTDDEYAAIAEDIKNNGLFEPIVLLDDQILDGVHRLRACIDAGIKPKYVKWDGEGGKPEQYVWSKNQTRRHLTKSQLAVTALMAEEHFAHEAKKRLSPKGREDRPVEKVPQVRKARDLAGHFFGVNPRYISDAKLLKANPALLEDVRTGKINLKAAVRQMKQPSGSPTRAKKPGRCRICVEWNGFKLLSEKMTEAEVNKLQDALLGVFPIEQAKITLIGKPKENGKRKKGAKKPKSGMYQDTQTWNPFKGCDFKCSCCVPSFQAQAKRQKHNCSDCYDYTPHYHEERLKIIPNAKQVFVCGNADIAFCEPDYLKRIIDAIKKAPPKKTFYLQTKKPSCLAPVLSMLPSNVILLTTLETNRDKGYAEISKAPPPSERFKQFLKLDYPRKVVTIEPIMDFDVDEFSDMILQINPEYVWIGKNSHDEAAKLPNPPNDKIAALLKKLLAKGIRVKGKRLEDVEVPPGVERTQD
jgi:hypothetical protein